MTRLLTPQEFGRHQMKVSGARKVQPKPEPVVRSKDVVKRKPKAKLCPTEHQEQCAVIQWFDSYAPTKNLDPRLLFAIPNGSHKSPAAAMKFKREGLRSGVMDLCLCKPQIVYGKVVVEVQHGLYVEMKRLRGSVTSPEQLEMKALFEAQGYRVVICKGAGEAIAEIERYLA